MAYSELIKNFDSVRSYMREFFVYGFRSREDFGDQKSLRSYDNEKRRITCVTPFAQGCVRLKTI